MKEEEVLTNWLKVWSASNETQKRQFAGVKALELGWGGISAVSNITGMSITTIRKGIRELKEPDRFGETKRIRSPGGGRKKIEQKDSFVIDTLEHIMNENTAGDPMSLLKWTNKSTYKISNEMKRLGYDLCPNSVARLLKEMDYSLQANVKSKEAGTGSERDNQFRYINKKVKQFITNMEPIISVDTKKRELIGDFKNNGRTWEKKGQPKSVNIYDFRTLAKGVAIPYGVYDILNNDGFVNVGTSYDTSEFAVESVRQWWNLQGKKKYPNTKD